MKLMMLKTGLTIAAAAALGLFAAGLLWSLVPVGGHTLPHWIEARAGMSFRLSALLASSVLALMCVSSIALSYVRQLLECDGATGNRNLTQRR